MRSSILDEASDRLVAASHNLARTYRHRQVDSQHLFCHLALQDSECQRWLQNAGCANPTALASKLTQRLTDIYGSHTDHVTPSARYIQVMQVASERATQSGSAEIQPSHLLEAILALDSELLVWLVEEGYSPQAFASEPSTPLIQQLCRDLTALAREGKLPPIQERHECQALVESLLNPARRNVLLVGEAGVGKTAIVELLAQKIVDGNVPQRLSGVRLLELNVSSLVAGTTYRGEFEARAQALMSELERLPNVLLFVDEFHTVISTGSTSEGGTTLANILKPALGRGQLSCIGATTQSEYRRYIERDRALVRRFVVLTVEETSAAETDAILRAHYRRLHQHRGIVADENTFAQIIELAARYLPARHFPDKAVDVLMRCAARAEIQKRTNIDEEMVAEIIGQMANIPLGSTLVPLHRRLANLEADLAAHVIGQDQALRTVADTLRVAWSGLRSPQRPRAVFLFVGSSGVGKTLLARILASTLFDDRNALIRLDMSEYKERYSVSRLIGAAPGYIGHDEPGQLTEALRRRPHSVVLLDEIEKAHPEVLDLFLQLFDEGRLTDSHGRTADGRHAIYIMTSNAISIQDTPNEPNEALGELREASGVEQIFIQAALRMHFRPEFLNRIDRVVTFQNLSKSHLRQIVQMEIEQLLLRLRQQNVQLTIHSDVYDYLITYAVRGTGAARHVQSLIEEFIALPISKYLLDATTVQGASLHLSVQGNHIRVERIV